MNGYLIIALAFCFVVMDVGHSGIKLAESAEVVVRKDVITNRAIMAVGMFAAAIVLVIYLITTNFNHIKI